MIAGPPARGGLPPVVVVEDNPDDEALLCEALRRARVAHPIVVARNGLDAVHLAVEARAGERPALVVVDLALPYLSGFDVIARLRAEPATMLVPAVVLSSSAERADIARAYATGASSYLVKPLEFRALCDLIARAARYWLRHNEPPPEASR